MEVSGGGGKGWITLAVIPARGPWAVPTAEASVVMGPVPAPWPSRATIASRGQGPRNIVAMLAIGTLTNDPRTQHRTHCLVHLNPDSGPSALV